MPARSQLVTARLASLLDAFPAETRSLAHDCLALLRRQFPVTHELVYQYPRSVVVSFGMSENGIESVAALKVSSSCVQIYLDKTLPDPDGLLKGGGGLVRGVTIESAAALNTPALKALLVAARDRAGLDPHSKPARQTHFKSDAKKKPSATRKT